MKTLYRSLLFILTCILFLCPIRLRGSTQVPNMISVLQVFHAVTVVDTRLPLESEAQAMMSHFPDSCCFSMMLRYSYTALTVSGTYTDTEGYLQECTFEKYSSRHASYIYIYISSNSACQIINENPWKSCESWCHVINHHMRVNQQPISFVPQVTKSWLPAWYHCSFQTSWCQHNDTVDPPFQVPTGRIGVFHPGPPAGPPGFPPSTWSFHLKICEETTKS